MPREIERFLPPAERSSLKEGKRRYQLIFAIMAAIEKLLALGAVSSSMAETYLLRLNWATREI